MHALEQQPDVATARAAAGSFERFSTRISKTDAGLIALFEGDAGWPTWDASVEGPCRRLLMIEPTWRFDVSL